MQRMKLITVIYFFYVKIRSVDFNLIEIAIIIFSYILILIYVCSNIYMYVCVCVQYKIKRNWWRNDMNGLFLKYDQQLYC